MIVENAVKNIYLKGQNAVKGLFLWGSQDQTTKKEMVW
jgi:hypothetical protein